MPHDLIAATVAANESRKNDLVDDVVAHHPERVGVYRLVAKHGSDNLRNSALSDIVELLVERGVQTLVYEPLLADSTFKGAPVTHDLAEFFASCDLVVANRMTDDLTRYEGTLFTRDLYHRD